MGMIIGIGILAVLAIVLVVVAMQPKQYRITRSARMGVPRETVFAQVNDFHRWDAWSPWAKLDPDMTTTHEGPAAGEGACYAWSGNKNVGEGCMEILESRAPELIRIRLEFIRPFASTCTTEFHFDDESGKTVVTWTMLGENNFTGKAFSMCMNMDKMIGKDFEKGLESMRAAAEGATAAQPVG